MLIVKDFWATWCGPCKAMTPTIEKLMEKYNTEDSQVKIEKIDVDQNMESAKAADVRGIPTLVFEKDGVIVDRISGNQPLVKIEELIAKHTD